MVLSEDKGEVPSVAGWKQLKRSSTSELGLRVWDVRRRFNKIPLMLTVTPPSIPYNTCVNWTMRLKLRFFPSTSRISIVCLYMDMLGKRKSRPRSPPPRPLRLSLTVFRVPPHFALPIVFASRVFFLSHVFRLLYTWWVRRCSQSQPFYPECTV